MCQGLSTHGVKLACHAILTSAFQRLHGTTTALEAEILGHLGPGHEAAESFLETVTEISSLSESYLAVKMPFHYEPLPDDVKVLVEGLKSSITSWQRVAAYLKSIKNPSWFDRFLGDDRDVPPGVPLPAIPNAFVVETPGLLPLLASIAAFYASSDTKVREMLRGVDFPPA